MRKIVNRVKLNKLYSDPEIFDPISFNDGVNIILGERSDPSTRRGRKTNGVGKSMSIEFLNFCLLKKYKDCRISLIPFDVVEGNIYIKLDMEIGDNEITISRNRFEEDKPIIEKNGAMTSFENLNDATTYLEDLIYDTNSGEVFPSFRSLISPLIRDERSEFKEILKPHDISQNIPSKLKPHLFFLNISIEAYNKTQDTVKKIDEVKKFARKIKKQITRNGKKISDVKAELNSLDDEINKINKAIENFKSNEAFNAIEKDLISLEDLLDKLRLKQKAVRYEYQKIKSLPKPEKIKNDEIEFVYNQFKEGLGDMIVKSLKETILFKTKIEEFQRSLINKKSKELKKELDIIAEEIRKLDEEYSEKLKLIDQKGVLKNLKVSLKVYNQKKDEYSRQKSSFDQYESAEKETKELYLEKSQEVLELDKLIDKNEEVLNNFLTTLLNIHDYIMGNKEGSFMIETVNKKNSKQIIKIEMRIFDDGSHSVDRTKVFIYDMSLMFNEYTRRKHPCLLIHDNIFDVDQDTLVQSLNFLEKQETKYQDFQYVLTLNRDKIEYEERLNSINLNIEEHKVASFTKQSKFLKKDYQEL